MEKIYLILLFILPCLGGAEGFSQNECAKNLAEARDKYNAGLFDQALSYVGNCLQAEDCSRLELSEALRLKALVHLEHGERSQADSAAQAILIIRPHYRVENEADEPEFMDLLQKMSPEVHHSVGFKLGTNISFANVLVNYSTGTWEDSAWYAVLPGLATGINFGLRINRHVNLQAELEVRKNRLQHVIKTPIFEEIRYRESMFIINIPFSTVYHFKKGKFEPFVRAGISPGLMLDGNSELEGWKDQTVQDSVPDFFLRGPSRHRRNRINFGVLAGAGFFWQKNNTRISFETRFTQGLMTLQKNYDPELALTGYVDDLFTLQHLEISIGIDFLITRVY